MLQVGWRPAAVEPLVQIALGLPGRGVCRDQPGQLGLAVGLAPFGDQHPCHQDVSIQWANLGDGSSNSLLLQGDQVPAPSAWKPGKRGTISRPPTWAASRRRLTRSVLAWVAPGILRLKRIG